MAARKAVACAREAEASEQSERVEVGASMMLVSTWMLKGEELDQTLGRLQELRHKPAGSEIRVGALALTMFGKVFATKCSWNFFELKPDGSHPGTPEGAEGNRALIKLGVEMLRDDAEPYTNIGAPCTIAGSTPG